MQSRTSVSKSTTFQPNEFIPEDIDEFVSNYRANYLDLKSGTKLRLKVQKAYRRKKINPILHLAKPQDAEIIASLFKETYNGTYPYKEFEDIEELGKMIESGLVNFILFKKISGEILGCLKFVLDFENKRGYQGGMAVRKAYLGKVDVVKAYLGSCVYFYNMYEDEILIWWGEARTAHSKVQYFTKLCGLLPLAFFPNKDVFLNKVESDLFVIAYYKKTLSAYRSKKCPIIIPEALNCFNYSNSRYNLGSVKVKTPVLNLDTDKISELQNKIIEKDTKDKFNYRCITFQFRSSDSYFKFLYTPCIQNFENVEYKVSNLEELYVFVGMFNDYIRRFDIRYAEVFISAYEPAHQKIFYDIGLTPRGYVPSWKYNKDLDIFEDCVVFNYFEGRISSDIDLIQEGWKLLEVLSLTPS